MEGNLGAGIATTTSSMLAVNMLYAYSGNVYMSVREPISDALEFVRKRNRLFSYLCFLQL